MLLAVHYRVDAHAYDPRRASCRPSCGACCREGVTYDSLQAALADQPPGEHLGERFEIVILEAWSSTRTLHA